MKHKYIVSQEQIDRKTVKTFRNEPEAVAFVSDEKNQRMYGGLLLEYKGADGIVYHWDASKGEWFIP